LHRFKKRLMLRTQNRLQKLEIPPRVGDKLPTSIGLFTLTRHGVSYNLFFPISEKSNVVDVKSKVRTKRVYHALHKKTPYQRCGYKTVVKGRGEANLSVESYS